MISISMKNLTMGLTSILINPEEKYWTKSFTLLKEFQNVLLCDLLFKGAWSKQVLNWQSKRFPLDAFKYFTVMLLKGT